MVIARVDMYDVTTLAVVFQTLLVYCGEDWVDFISPNKNIKESKRSTARFLAPSRSSECVLLSFVDTWDIQVHVSFKKSGVKYSRRDSPTVTNVGGVRAEITRKKEYEHEEKRCRHRRWYSLPLSLILTRGYMVSSFLYEEADH